MAEHETPEHAQTIIMPSDLKKLKEVTGEKSTKEALSKAVHFTIDNIGKNKKKFKPHEPLEPIV